MKSEFPATSAVILVHAAWADGSCWSNIIVPLQQRGLRVICAPIPMTTLGDDAAAVSRVLERTSGPAVLVGHAYSGAVIAAIREERIKSLVYIAALAPDEGEPVDGHLGRNSCANQDESAGRIGNSCASGSASWDQSEKGGGGNHSSLSHHHWVGLFHLEISGYGTSRVVLCRL